VIRMQNDSVVRYTATSDKTVERLKKQDCRPWQPVDVVRLAPGPWLESLKSLVIPQA
jgi:hypothetical protein